ncbi:MAG TPA: hypothetical protein VFE47_12235 [Tepidisphaeraceae bacterium]|jgi:hypothetical protein|nr:hypothetical protein [Tepidisphaeraceae bacterium]
MGTRLAIYSAALLAASGLFASSTFGQVQQAAPPAQATQAGHDPAPATAAAKADVPVKQVVLFSSGVGYFEHRGKVSGDATTELRFKTDQINDILKSLLLQDMDGGTVGTVSYPGLAPLAHTLKSFQVDITANPDMADLLNQLRGAKITVTPVGSQKMTGIILGVEKKLQANGDKAVVETVKLNLKVGRLFRSVNLDSIDSMELDDPALQKELDDALGAVAKSRDQDKKPVTLHFNGKGERRIRIGYLVETPIWKTSYRLVLNPPEEKKAADNKKPEENKAAPRPGWPATAPAAGAGGAADAAQPAAKLQGWAIVENQTDNDWNDIQLSLVSGQPLSFIQDLYHSQYIPRPVVQADNYASLRPQTYSGGIYDVKDLLGRAADLTDAPDFGLNTSGQNQQPQGGGGIGAGGGGGGNSLFGGAPSRMANQQQQGQQQNPIDPTASIISAATAARVGELFKYRVNNVSLARQTSAMIPIVTDDIDAERVSIFNAGVLLEHPLLGARVKNNTGKYLLQGPVTVLDHGSYAGDARLEDLPPGQERLISFGIDQQLQIELVDAKEESNTVTAKIAKGVMTVTSRKASTQGYLADNKSDETRVLVIEQPRMAGFQLVKPEKAEETTADLYRFRRVIPAHKVAKLTVAQEHVQDALVQILPLASADLSAYLKDNAIPQKVRDALAKAVDIKNQIAGQQARLAEMHHQMDEFSADQARIRENLKAVAAESDYYKRLMKKIDERETGIEQAQKNIADMQATIHATEKQLADYLAGLNVE